VKNLCPTFLLYRLTTKSQGITKNLKEDSKKDILIREIRDLWNNGVFRTLIYFGLILFFVYAFQEALILALRTPYPLQTPISGSMEPTLKVGDLLIVQGVSAESIAAGPKPYGDIIVFKKPSKPDELIVHRAIEKFKIDSKWYFRTQGDNNPSLDPWTVSEDQIVGKVIYSIPFLGYIKIYLGTPQGIVINIILILALLLLENLASSKSMKEKSEKEETIEEETSK